MTLPASGAIKMSDIRGEFGGSAPDNLSEYYRGGGLVPNTPGNATIPTSGAIKISDFYGTSNVSVNVPAPDMFDEGFTFTTNFAQATVSFNNNGTTTYTGANTGASGGPDWITPTGAAPDLYEVRCDVNSGALSSGTTGTWLPFSSGSYSWSCTVSGAGFASANVTISVRYNGGAVLSSNTGTITAQVS